MAGKSSSHWHGTGGDVHTRVLQRMRQALLEDTDYAYLQPGARERLRQARGLAGKSGLAQHSVLSLGGDTCCVFPWLGSVAYRTLNRLLRFRLRDRASDVSGLPPYYLTLDWRGSASDLLEAIKAQLAPSQGSEPLPESLLGPEEEPRLSKYDEFVPPGLLRKSFTVDALDMDELRRLAKSWGG